MIYAFVFGKMFT